MNQSCPPKIAVEAYFLEGLDPLRIKDHVQACSTCAEVKKALNTDRDAFLQRYPLSRLLTEIEPKRKSFIRRAFEAFFEPRSLIATLTIAGLAGLMLVTLRPHLPGDDESQIQIKGGVGLSFFATPGGPKGKIQRGEDGMSLPAGADIQFVYSNEKSPYLYLVGIEQNGDITAYFPDRGVQSGPIQTGSQIRLPQGLSWEPKSTYERFYALFSQEPIPIEAIRSATSQIETEGKTVEQTTKLPLPYAQASILVHRKNGQ